MTIRETPTDQIKRHHNTAIRILDKFRTYEPSINDFNLEHRDIYDSAMAARMSIIWANQKLEELLEGINNNDNETTKSIGGKKI